MSQSGSYNTSGGGGSGVNTLTGNTGGAVSPSAGNINVVGTGSISVTGNPGTNTLTIASSGSGGIVTLDGDSGSATGTTVTIAGGSNITTSATAATVTVDLDNTVSISGHMTAGTGITSTTGNIVATAGQVTAGTSIASGTTITSGTTLTAGTGLNVSSFGRGMVRSSAVGALSSINGTDGQVIIAATGADPAWASITAGSGISITPGANTLTIAATGGGSGITTLDGDTGSATGATVTIAGGSNINTTATGSTVTVNLDGTISIAGSITCASFVDVGSGVFQTTGPTVLRDSGSGNSLFTFPSSHNTFIGLDAGDISLSGGNNTGVGFAVLGTTSTAGKCTAIGSESQLNNDTGSENTSVGYISLEAVNGAGINNTAIGSQSGQTISTGTDNTALGRFSLRLINTGSFNLSMGSGSGSGLLTSESDNILMSNVGTAGDNNKIRIGTQGTGNGQQNSCFIAGIRGITPAMSPEMVTIGSDGELGSQAIPGGGGFTWSEITASTVAMAVANGYILNNAGGVTATLPATAAVGDLIELVGKGTGGWTLAQNSGQTIHFGAQNTTTGAGGSIAPLALPADQYATLSLVCTTANTNFVVKSSVGNFNVI